MRYETSLVRAQKVRGVPAVVVGCFDGYIRAYAREDGALLWQTGLRDHVYASPAQLSTGATAVAVTAAALIPTCEIPLSICRELVSGEGSRVRHRMANIFAQRRIIGLHSLPTASLLQMQIIFHAKIIAIMELPPGDFSPNSPHSSSVKSKK